MTTIEEMPKEHNLCGQIIGAAMKVHSTSGSGFLESVLSKWIDVGVAEGRIARRNRQGDYCAIRWADCRHIYRRFVGNESLIVELKATQPMAKAHEVQLVRKFWLPKQEQVSF